MTCRSCGKPTWTGCGNHVEQALRGVPQSERCNGHARTAPAEGTTDRKSNSFLSRLFGEDR
jgi:hypothetical protein